MDKDTRAPLQPLDESNKKKLLRDIRKKNIGDYFHMLGYEDAEKYAKNKKVAIDLDIPDIDEEEDVDTSEDIDTSEDMFSENEGVENSFEDDITSDFPIEDTKDLDDMQDAIDSINESVNDLEISKKIENAKSDIMQEVQHTIRDLKEELADLRSRKMPARKHYETESAYKENAFTIASYVLDDVLPDLFNSVPDYSLIGTSISQTYDDGTIKDAIIAVSVTVPNNNFRYDFKVDVPILNGIAQAPLYIQRGIRIIPLTEDAIQEELESLSFRKVEVNDQQNKDNMFSYVGEGRYTRQDKQKVYPVKPNNVDDVQMPPSPRWTHMEPHRK